MNIGEYEVRPVMPAHDAPEPKAAIVHDQEFTRAQSEAQVDTLKERVLAHSEMVAKIPTAAQMNEAWERGVKAAEESHALGRVVLAAGKVALQATRPEFPYPTPSRVVIDSGAGAARHYDGHASNKDWYETMKAARDRHWQQKDEAKESITSELRRTMTAWPMDARLMFFEQTTMGVMPKRVTITARWEPK